MCHLKEEEEDKSTLSLSTFLRIETRILGFVDFVLRKRQATAIKLSGYVSLILLTFCIAAEQSRAELHSNLWRHQSCLICSFTETQMKMKNEKTVLSLNSFQEPSLTKSNIS